MSKLKHADLLVIALLLFRSMCSERLREIRLQGFLPMTGTEWPAGAACLPATLMAVRHVNERVGLLDGYNVTYTWADSKCNAGVATFEMFKTLSTPPPKNMLLGCGCSVASVPTAQVSHLFNLTQISYGSLSPALSDRSRFPNFYQMDIPDHASNPAKIALMREFNWTRVATINEAGESYHTRVIDDFVQRVTQTDNITIITQELFHADPFRRVENLKKRDARIIIVQMYEDKARMTLCAAYKLGLYGRKYVWIYNNWQSAGFWKPRNDFPCREEEMRQAIEGAFLVGSYSRNPRLERGIAGLTVSEFDALYRKEDTYDPSNDMFYWCAPFSYDHIWIASLALNCTETYLRSIDHPKYLDEFTYQDSDINGIILSCMNNLSLVGVSGRIFYGGNAAPDSTDIQIERIQGSKRITVGSYILSEGSKRFEWIKDALKWEDNKVPTDSHVVRYEEIIIPMWLYMISSSCAGIGILLVVGCSVFNLIYKHCKALKVSSPTITSIWLLGCVLIYSTVFMTTTISPTAMICKAKTFCFSVGFTVAVGALYFETWRIYKIFLNKKRREYCESKKVRRGKTRAFQVRTLQRPTLKPDDLQTTPKEISNCQVIGRVFTLGCGILILLIIWETVSPQILLIRELVKEVYVTDDDTEVRPFVRVCNSNYGVYFSWSIYIIEGAILVFGAFLTWETRNVKQEVHNDTQVGMCLYNTMVLSAFGLTVSLLLQDKIVIVYGLTSGCIILGTTVNLLIVFVPKVCFIHQGQSSVHPTEQMINAGVTPMAMATGTVVSQTAVSQIEDRE